VHKNNKHQGDYDFNKLSKVHEPLAEHVYIGKSGKQTIDFSKQMAVKVFNTALLKYHYEIEYWQFPHKHLCPAIPGRAEYIHLVYDLLKSSGIDKDAKLLDIGTGATCIYPLLGSREYNWNFIASETDKNAFENSAKIIKMNNLGKQIELRFQSNWESILKGIIKADDKISATICNPPFYKNQSDADKENRSKLTGLGHNSQTADRNFSGTQKELIYPGGEKAFLHNYLYQSSLFKTNCFWFTSLVSKKKLVESMRSSLKKLGAKEIKTISMQLGNKTSRVVAWTFLSLEEQKTWKN